MVDIRLAQEVDALGLATLLSNNLSEAWSQRAILDAIRNPLASVVVAVDTDDAEAILGMALMFHAGGQGEIEQVAVDGAHRQGGIGGMLLDELFIISRNLSLDSIVLEVREGNIPAKSLYIGRGFQEVGRRKNFYQNPCEDALILLYNMP